MSRSIVAFAAACAFLAPPLDAQTKKDKRPKQAKETYVIIKADLFEADDAAYQALSKFGSRWKSINQVLEEFVNTPKGKAPEAPTLFDTLEKQKPILAGKPIELDPGHEVELLAMKRTINLLPHPEELRQGRGAPQTIDERLALRAQVLISPDRRSVRVIFAERTSAIEGVTKESVVVDNEGTRKEGETAFVKEATVSSSRDISDGGTYLLALTHWPREQRDKGAWLVARVTVRIWIDAEERAIREQGTK